jgi:assimilatory nitrate reductase catalytic subunit
MMRKDGAGFVPVSWNEALDKVANEIKRIQQKYGNDAFALIGGASLTNEKAYLMGKFARVAVKTANIDYNGRLCMVSAAAASKKIFGIDRAANPWRQVDRDGPAHDPHRPQRRSLYSSALGRRHRRLQRHAARHD